MPFYESISFHKMAFETCVIITYGLTLHEYIHLQKINMYLKVTWINMAMGTVFIFRNCISQKYI